MALHCGSAESHSSCFVRSEADHDGHGHRQLSCHGDIWAKGEGLGSSAPTLQSRRYCFHQPQSNHTRTLRSSQSDKNNDNRDMSLFPLEAHTQRGAASSVKPFVERGYTRPESNLDSSHCSLSWLISPAHYEIRKNCQSTSNLQA